MTGNSSIKVVEHCRASAIEIRKILEWALFIYLITGELPEIFVKIGGVHLSRVSYWKY